MVYTSGLNVVVIYEVRTPSPYIPVASIVSESL